VHEARPATLASLSLTADRRSHDEVFVVAVRHTEAPVRDVEHEFESTQVASIDLGVRRRGVAVVRNLCPAGGAMPGHMNLV